MTAMRRFWLTPERWYLPFVLSLWCLAPGLRRLMDWQFGRNPLSLLSVFPMLSLLPLAYFVYRNASSPHVRWPFRTIAYFWLFGFVYALVVALASGRTAGALYDFAEFCFPMLVGAWVAMRRSSRADTFKQLSRTLLWLSFVEGVYGLIQFVSPLPWDVKYVTDVHQASLGTPEPFGLHPFSLLNSPGTLSVFFVLAILLNLHRLDLRRPWPLFVVILSITVLMLTNVRSSWLALLVGVAVYLLLSPKRGKAIFALGAVGGVALMFVLNASTLLGNADVTSQLQSRFSTLGDVSQDPSVNDRQEETNFALHQGLEDPLGQGLGSVGTSVWLEGGEGGGASVAQLVLDNGYVSRFLEMGVPGCIAYLASLICGVLLGLRAVRIGALTRNSALTRIAVAGLGVQLALAGLDLSSDSHLLLPGLMFWIVIGLSVRYEEGDDILHSVFERVNPPPASSARPLWTS